MRRWILPLPPRVCQRCADGAADEDAAEESRRLRDGLLCPHYRSTSPSLTVPPVELGDAVSEECSTGLRAVDDDGDCSTRALAGLVSGWEEARY